MENIKLVLFKMGAFADESNKQMKKNFLKIAKKQK